MIVTSWMVEMFKFAGFTHQSALTSQTLEFGWRLRSRECRNTHLAECKTLNQLDFGLPFCKFLPFHIWPLFYSLFQFFDTHHCFIHFSIQISDYVNDVALWTFEWIFAFPEFVEEGKSFLYFGDFYYLETTIRTEWVLAWQWNEENSASKTIRTVSCRMVLFGFHDRVN
jgi:hypothetical protein